MKTCSAMNHRMIYVFCLGLMLAATDVSAQRKGLLSSDQLLTMALEETNQHHNYEKAIALCRKALELSPGYPDVKLLLGRLYVLTRQPAAARLEWLEVLRKQPPNREALDYLINLENSLGRGKEAICYIDMALEQDPLNKELLFKKHGLLTEFRQTESADKVLTLLATHYGSDPKVRSMREEAAQAKERLARAALQPEEKPAPPLDPKLVALDRLQTALAAARKKNDHRETRAVAEKILAEAPGNRDAFLAIINSYHRQEQYGQALHWLNKALAQSGSDEDLLRRKTGLLQEMRRYDEAAVTARQLLWKNGSHRNLQAFRDIQLQRAAAFDRAGRYTEAGSVIDTLLQYAPADTMLLFKKAGLLEAGRRYEEAAAVTRQLLLSAPSNKKYQQAYAEQMFAAAREQLRNQAPEKARPLLETSIRYAPANAEAWHSLINLDNSTGNVTGAIALCDSAMAVLGPQEDLRRKKSALLQAANRLPEAYAIAGELVKAAPENRELQQMYADQLTAHGRQLQQAQAWDSALAVYRKAYAYQPTDTLLVQQMVNTFLASHQYDSTVAYADKGLQLQPAHETLLMKKAAALEAQHQYKAAAETVSVLLRARPEDNNLRDGYYRLRSKTYRNQAGIIHLQSIYDNGSRPANVTALQYLRFHEKGSIGGRVSYADRAAGSGVQLEAETYYTHSKNYYSYGLLGWSTGKVFPKFRAGYSLFRNLGREWEAELGTRYLKTDSASNYAAVWSAAKTWGAYWANLRGYVITEEGNWYHAYVLTNRFYLHEQQDFIALTLSLGNTPDDRSRNYQFNQQAAFLAGGAGIGYQKTFAYRTTMGVFGNWTYQRLTNDRHYNQFDIYLTLLRKF